MQSIYLDHNLVLESAAPVEQAEIILLGVPFDSTSSYRPGSRFAPLEIRKEFLELEKEGFYGKKFYDAGNVNVVPGNAAKTIENTKNAVQDVNTENSHAKLFVLGGEHLITYGVIRAYPKDTLIVQFDAHKDLKDDYLGEKLSHATVMRRISELGYDIIQVGARSTTREEEEYANTAGILGYSADSIKELGEKVRGRNVYVSLDFDVLDPSLAPGVSNPEPGGLDLNTLTVLLNTVFESSDVVGLDLVEVCPPFDDGATTVTAAKMLLDVMIR